MCQFNIKAGSRSVVVTAHDDRYTATLYVNGGETITARRWTGKTEAGARRWAFKVLNEFIAADANHDLLAVHAVEATREQALAMLITEALHHAGVCLCSSPAVKFWGIIEDVLVADKANPIQGYSSDPWIKLKADRKGLKEKELSNA